MGFDSIGWIEMWDFTLKAYNRLLNVLQSQRYSFQTVAHFSEIRNRKSIILRHDVDRLPENSLKIAQLEKKLGIGASYYFRAVPESWNEGIILEIASLGHEVGYHYESLTTCWGNVEKAFIDFKRNLEKLRNLVPVSTICMHGSPSFHGTAGICGRHTTIGAWGSCANRIWMWILMRCFI